METTQALHKRAAGGDADALFRLGYRLAFGRTRPRPTDWTAVYPLWAQAANAGHLRALFYVGVCHEHGRGTPPDLPEALRWYEKAARQGHDVAMYDLAFSYRTGEGVPQDYEQMHF